MEIEIGLIDELHAEIEVLKFNNQVLREQVSCLMKNGYEKNNKIDNLKLQIKEAKFVIKHLGNQ